MFIILFFMLPYFAQAGLTPCSRALLESRMSCAQAKELCSTLNKCLVRRDTCANTIPNNESTCLTINSCSIQFENTAEDDGFRCRYRWVRKDNSQLCVTKKNILFSEAGCPSIKNDSKNISCYAVLEKRSYKVQECQYRLQYADAVCGKTMSDHNYFLNSLNCNEADNYENYQNQEFAIDLNKPTRVNDISRSEAERPSSLKQQNLNENSSQNSQQR